MDEHGDFHCTEEGFLERPDLIVIGALWGAIGVALAAWGAHGKEEVIVETEHREWWTDGVRLQMWHAPVILLAGWIGRSEGPSGRRSRLGGWFLTMGSLVFSGTLYAMALGGPPWLGAVTPFGGLSLIVGWLALGWAACSRSTTAGS